MKKIITQGVILIAIFFSIWKGLSQINWLEILFINKISQKTEEKIGDFYVNIFKTSSNEIDDEFIVNSVDSIVNHICVSNYILKKPSVYIIYNEEINAFALPNRNIIIFSGLIKNSDSHQQLAGVIAHEIAHIELNHVMKKLIKELGLSVVLSSTTGNNGNLAKEGAKILSSTAFDRQMEREADLKAADYLTSANVNPSIFADFLDKLYDNESELINYLQWISTHPNSDDRARVIRNYSNDKEIPNEDIIAQSTWDNMIIKMDILTHKINNLISSPLED